MSDIGARKNDHIELCATGDVGFRDKTTLFDDLELVHDALPEVHADDIDLTTTVLGKRLKAPILIAAMTGGTLRAGEINRALAALAEARGLAFGLGSQRPMLRSAEPESFAVRKVAPSTLILGNLGGVQAAALKTAEVQALVDAVAADALCIHLNPAMETVQPGGDRDFRGVFDTIVRLNTELTVPVVVKETGCGLSRQVAKRLVKAGVRHVDVSGAGGTSWVAVETERASNEQRSLGQAFRDWGIPTAASVALCASVRPRLDTIFATGGMNSGLHVAKALSLGATAVGMARPILQALIEGGELGAGRFLDRVENELRAAMLLVGARRVTDLPRAPKVVGPTLRAWLGARRSVSHMIPSRA